MNDDKVLPQVQTLKYVFGLMKERLMDFSPPTSKINRLTWTVETVDQKDEYGYMVNVAVRNNELTKTNLFLLPIVIAHDEAVNKAEAAIAAVFKAVDIVRDLGTLAEDTLADADYFLKVCGVDEGQLLELIEQL